MVAFDNAESILDPQATSSQEIYTIVDELAHFDNICLYTTFRIPVVPPHRGSEHPDGVDGCCT